MMRRNFKKKFFCVVIFKKLHYLCGTIRLMEQGLVIKNTGSWYIVRTPDGTERNCKIKGNLRLKGFRCTNPVAVGDNVEIEVKEDGTAFIRSILPRRNYIIRRASNLSREFQILAANLDMAVLVVTLVNPETSTVFIDRFLATAEAYQVPVTIVFNKIDLLAQPEDRQLLDAITRCTAQGGRHIAGAPHGHAHHHLQRDARPPGRRRWPHHRHAGSEGVWHHRL